ncbi:hypothetical protein [Endozoicomonas ascidiicola]|uniref:hypothetical protein n=2 Tax=Endozoicomonas ascidiicola TaxID=1698521 RepID=UPI0012FE3D2C|nr:hypothetical protein [Endozoicomonas ascidiicola]
MQIQEAESADYFNLSHADENTYDLSYGFTQCSSVESIFPSRHTPNNSDYFDLPVTHDELVPLEDIEPTFYYNENEAESNTASHTKSTLFPESYSAYSDVVESSRLTPPLPTDVRISTTAYRPVAIVKPTHEHAKQQTKEEAAGESPCPLNVTKQSKSRKDSRKAYRQSEKYKAYQKAYHQSEKYKAYKQSDKYKASQKAYKQSEKYKASQKAYKQSEKYKASQKAYHDVLSRTGDREQAKIAGKNASAAALSQSKK